MSTKNRVAVVESSASDGEAPVIVGLSDAAMHMYAAAIEALPEEHDPEFPNRAGVILSGLRKLQKSLSEAASRSRVTPSVIVALSGVRISYDELMERAANGPGATLGQRLYVARLRAKLSTKEAANGVGLRRDIIEALESEEPATEDETAKIKDLIAALGG
jgi:DNA-binding XRE family transcriptional regulator